MRPQLTAVYHLEPISANLNLNRYLTQSKSSRHFVALSYRLKSLLWPLVTLARVLHIKQQSFLR